MNFFTNTLKRFNDGPLKAELDQIHEKAKLAQRPHAAFAKVPPAQLKQTISQIKKRLGLAPNVSISDLQDRLNAADEQLRLKQEEYERVEAEREERRQAKRRNARQAASPNTQKSVVSPQKANKQPPVQKRRMADPATATSSSAPPNEHVEDNVDLEDAIDEEEDDVLAPLVDVEEEEGDIVPPTPPPRTRRAQKVSTEEVVTAATPNVVMTKQRKARVEAERLKTKADRIASVIAMPPTPSASKKPRKAVQKEDVQTTSPELTSTEEDTDLESSEAPTVLGGFGRTFNLFGGGDNSTEKEASSTPVVKRPTAVVKAARPSQNKSVKFQQQSAAAPAQRMSAKKKQRQQEVEEETDEETDDEEEEDSPPPQRRKSNSHASKKQLVAASKSYRCRCFSWRYLCYALLALVLIVLIYYILWFLTYAMCLVGSTAGFNTCWLWHRPTSYYASSVLTTNLIVEPPPIVSPTSLTVASQQQQQQSWWQYATGGSWWSGRSTQSQSQQQSTISIQSSDKPFPQQQQGQPKQTGTSTVSNQQPNGNPNRVPPHHPGVPNNNPATAPAVNHQQAPPQNIVAQRKQPVCAPNVAVNEYFGLLVKSYNDRTIGREQITKSGANDLCFALLTNGNRHQHITMRREVLMIYDTCSFNTMEEFFQKVNQNLVPFDHELSEEFAMLVHDQAMSDAAAASAAQPSD